MKTKAAVLWGVGEPWSVEEVELDDPVAGEVQVRLTASGLCHSDHHLVTGATPLPFFPAVGGHEGAGVVTKVGPGVEHLSEGDHVVLAFIPACGRCPACSAGQQNLCDLGANLLSGEAIAGGSRLHVRGKPAIPMCLLGTFCPYVTVHNASVVKITDDLPLDRAALVGCGVTTGWGSATRMADVRPGDTVVVMGIGGVGINAVQGAARAGARRVIAIDPVPYKLERAREFGATHTFGSVDEAIEPLRALTWGRMADKTLLTVGHLEGEHIQQSLGMTGKGGRVVVVGMGDASAEAAKINLFFLTLLQMDLQGAIFGGGNPRAEIPRLLGMYTDGLLKLDELVTRTYRLEDINQGYRDMLDGKNLRGIIAYTDADY